MMSEARIPSAVYRVQMHAGMRFEDARAIVPYLRDLGVSDLYASPILQARRGSTHGYDVTDPTRINPELGTEEEFEKLSRELQSQGMGLLLDIVPNHLAASSENPWWMDMLEEGPGSVYSTYFDVDWHPPSRSLDNRLLLPVLGNPFAAVLENGELSLEFEQGSFFIHYADARFPVAPRSYRVVLDLGLDALRDKLGAESAVFQELEGIRSEIEVIRGRTGLRAGEAGDRRVHRSAVKERLGRLYAGSAEIREFVEGNLRLVNGQAGVPESFINLERLLSLQPYVLAYWRNTNQGINYRRFFTITDLVGVRVEDPITFDAVHSVILRLAAKNLVTGLRIDHIDGLRDPESYLRRVQERLGKSLSVAANATTEEAEARWFYVVVEKILGAGEALPEDWPVAGTTGYDFLSRVNGLFVDGRNMAQLDRVYQHFVGQRLPFQEQLYEKKKQVMASLLAVEMDSLGRQLSVIAEQDRYARELPQGCLTEALVETIACFPIYRTYIRGGPPRESEGEYIENAIAEAERKNPRLDRGCFEFLRQVLLVQSGSVVLPEQREARLNFILRWQQFTGPIMAKGFEDSLLYVFNRLVSLNDVGGTPDAPGVSVEELHDFGVERQRRWPNALNATTTHDTKRSEDVRARISVLSEMPAEWDRRLTRWHLLNEVHCASILGQPVPTRNEEMLIYQTLLGAWPLEESARESFRERLQGYMIKATREAMVHTKWTVPNVPHEEAVARFVDAILRDADDNEFLRDFLDFVPRIAFYGAINGLAQALIKITFPGIPDFYQGSELWDLRLVDPDNRGPVDFGERVSLLEALKKSEGLDDNGISELLGHWLDGRIKMHVIARALCFRRSRRELFGAGQYVCLETGGKWKDQIFAFGRRLQDRWCLVVTPRLAAALTSPGQFPLADVWQDTCVRLPQGAPANWRNLLAPEEENCVSEKSRALKVSEVLRRFPLGLLEPAYNTCGDRDGKKAG
jgi:(1->4)-alpha-D-glucan 1-alpha-D-glucosylmutase